VAEALASWNDDETDAEIERLLTRYGYAGRKGKPTITGELTE
jgi:hypothetical protein